MAGFPEITQEDFDSFEALLRDYVVRNGVTLAVFVHRAGPLLSYWGEVERQNVEVIATLASNAYTAGESLIRDRFADRSFSSVTLNGENFSGMVMGVDEHSLLLVVFKTTLNPGSVRSTSLPAVLKLRERMREARARNPDASYDLVDENKPNVSDVFKKKQP